MLYTPAQLRDKAKTFLVAYEHQEQHAFTVLAMLSWSQKISPEDCLKRIFDISEWKVA